MTRVLVVASTFPASDEDTVPAFVKDQIIAMKRADPSLQFSVLAPHDQRSRTKRFTKHPSYDEHRFHYAWPSSIEKLAGRGIMPALKENPFNYFLLPFFFVGEFCSLLSLTRKIKPDYLYAHWFTPQAIIARFVGFLTRTPFVFTTHAADVDAWRRFSFFGTWIVRSNVRRAKALTAVSRRSMEKLERFFTPAESTTIRTKSLVIPMGVELPQKTTDSLRRSPYEIVFIGRLVEKKGVQYLLPAIKTLSEQFDDVHLVVAGDGPWLTTLKQQAKELGVINRVSFPGYTTGKDKETLLESGAVFVVPSIMTKSGDTEGLPVSLLEGLAYGNVCVATRESGADDILIDEKNGFLVTEKDSDELAAAIGRGFSLSDPKRSALTKAGRQTAEQFSWDIIATKHIKFLFRKKA